MNAERQQQADEPLRRRRPPPNSTMMVAYAACGCVVAVTLFLGHLGYTLAFGAVLLFVLAAFRPQAGTASCGALLFVWTPALLVALFGLLVAVDSGNGTSVLAPLIVFFIAGTIFTPVFVVVALIGAGVGVFLFPIVDSIPGHCPNCDYNLRGLTSDRCPECGATCHSGKATP